MTIQKIFDRNRFRLHRDRAAKIIDNHSFLIELSSMDILERLVSMDTEANSILEVGARTGFLTKKLMASYPHSNIIATDISEAMLNLNPAQNKILLDEEGLGDMKHLSGQNSERFDIIASVLNLHHINDFKKFFFEVAKLLKPNGVFVASLFGAGSLTNLRNFLLQAEIATNSGHSPHISPFATASDIYRLLQLAGFQFIVTETHKIDIEYDNPLACMRELRNMGESSNLVHGTRSLTKAMLRSAKSGSFSDHAEIITLTAGLGLVKSR